ncbi:hypothetical protein TRFO_27844 [Tritrichomonas foetus]|uniref:Uncharacterized protein n=1 Tax=Tritrichomonas foetus TaxID=1144522 RepID=A0A1J4JZP6_9EUKA|nr:hypothetical protein TRFO_27844 [Tritrichomonas foetus]|eukprot:OHT04633.1 hypothetical protein TRFO_27844 [Tritrichomonas foetus]
MSDSEGQSTLAKLMALDGSSLEKVLLEPSLEQAAKSNSVELRKYLSRHLPRLLRTAFKDDNSETTLQALKLLTYGSVLVIPNLVKTNFFPEFAMKYLSRQTLSERRVGRLCEVTFSIFQSGVKDIIKDCNYILTLFKNYCDHLSVYNLFSKIFTGDDKLQYHRDWLVEIGFDKELVTILKELLKKNYTDTTFTTDSEKVINLFKLVADAAKHESIRRKIIQSEVFDIFKQTYSLPHIINNFYWEAVNNLYDVEYHSKFQIHIDAAKKILYKPEKRIYRYHAEALSLLVKVINHNSDLVNEKLIKNVINLMMLFSESSFFLCEARIFFQKCYNIKDVRDLIVKKLVPLMMNETKSEKHGLMPIFAMAILTDMTNNESTNKLLKKVDGTSKFIKQKLEPYVKKLNSEYGGEYKNENDQVKASPSRKKTWETKYPK